MEAKQKQRFEELAGLAKKEIELADHLLYVTYQMINEVKFLLAITNHVVNAASAALEAILEFEHYWKRLDAFPRSFAYEISIFKQKIEDKYGFDPKFVRLLRKLLEVKKFDKESIVKFKRGNKYILTSGEYSSITVLDVESVKRYSNLTKTFVKRVGEIIGGNKNVGEIGGSTKKTEVRGLPFN
jgi:hypothetical protein